VGSVPCLINFLFDNEYSWFREKLVSYKITVTPPSRETLMAGRRRRAKACLKAVVDDLSSAEQRLEQASSQKQSLEQQVQRLMQELEEKQKSLQVADNEEKWLVNRVNLRNGQKDLLRERLKDGWDDEKPPTTSNVNGSS
jgi:chromosome segregation ATPase